MFNIRQNFTYLRMRIRNVSNRARAKFVKILNLGALAFAALVTAINSMYPTAVSDAAGALPPFAKLAVLAAWAGIIHYALKPISKTPDPQ